MLTAAKSVQSWSATSPASGPYVSPKFELTRNDSASRSVASVQSSTATPDAEGEPRPRGLPAVRCIAEQRAQPGGDQERSRAGHRSTEPTLVSTSPRPNASRMNAIAMTTPALTARTNARAYFSCVGRSCSMPYSRFSDALELTHRDRPGDEQADEAEHERRDSGRRCRRGSPARRRSSGRCSPARGRRSRSRRRPRG